MIATSPSRRGRREEEAKEAERRRCEGRDSERVDDTKDERGAVRGRATAAGRRLKMKAVIAERCCWNEVPVICRVTEADRQSAEVTEAGNAVEGEQR